MTTKEKPKDFDNFIRVSSIVFSCGDEILIFKRSAHKKIGANKWALCAGKVADLESYEEAAIRECKEETGLTIKIEDLKKIDTYYHSPEIDRNFKIELVCFEVKVTAKPVIILNDEHTEYKWVNKNKVLEYDLIDGEEYFLKNYFSKNW